MIRAALVGVSGYGKIHLREYLRLAAENRVKLAAAVVINPEETAVQLAKLAELGTKIYSSTREMWAAEAGKIDLCSLPVAIAAHEALLCEALEHGANVLLEKPAAGCTASVDRMIAVRDRAGKEVLVGFQTFYSPETHEIKAVLEAGIIGPVRRIACMGIGPRADEYYVRNRWAARVLDRGIPVYDSPFCNAFAHSVNLAIYWSGSSVTGAAGTLARARGGIEMFDNCAVRIDTAAGIPVFCYYSHTGNENVAQTIRIDGEKGTLCWNMNSKRWSAADLQGKALAGGPIDGTQSTMFNRIMARLDGDREIHTCSLERAREHVRAVEMLYHSSRIQTLPQTAYHINFGGQYVLNDSVNKRIPEWFRDCIIPEHF